MTPTAAHQLCELTHAVESCAGVELFHAQLRAAQDAALSILGGSGPSAGDAVQAAFEQLGPHQRRRRIMELVLWPTLDKPALSRDASALPSFVWQFQLPVVATLHRGCLARANTLNPLGLDTATVGAALVDSAAFRDVNVVACWPSLYRREDFYATGPLRMAQLMVRLFHDGEADVVQPLPVILDPAVPHGRVVTFHLWLGARTEVGSAELLSQEGLENEVRGRIAETVAAYLTRQGIATEALTVLEPQRMATGYATRCPAWQQEMEQTLRLAAKEFGAAAIRLQFPAPGYFELLADDRSIVVPATAVAMPRAVLREDVARACASAGLVLSGSFTPAIQVSGLVH